MKVQRNDIGWLRRELNDLWKAIREQAAGRRLEAASIGEGGLVIQNGGSIVVQDGGDLRILDPDGSVVFSAQDGPLRSDFAQVDINTLTFPDATWTEYAVQTIPVPIGFTRAFVNLFASAGGTFTGATGGNVGVQPVADGNGGPGLSNGTPAAGPCSVNSSAAFNLTALGDTIRLSAYCQRSGAVTAGSNNVHLSASIIFLR